MASNARRLRDDSGYFLVAFSAGAAFLAGAPFLLGAASLAGAAVFTVAALYAGADGLARVTFSALTSAFASACFLCGPRTMIMLLPPCLGGASTNPRSVSSAANRWNRR